MQRLSKASKEVEGLYGQCKDDLPAALQQGSLRPFLPAHLKKLVATADNVAVDAAAGLMAAMTYHPDIRSAVELNKKCGGWYNEAEAAIAVYRAKVTALAERAEAAAADSPQCCTQGKPSLHPTTGVPPKQRRAVQHHADKPSQPSIMLKLAARLPQFSKQRQLLL